MSTADNKKLVIAFYQALASNTHQGTYLGIAPTGRSVIFNSTDIMRLRGDRLAEHWGTVDLHGLLQQLTKK